MKLSERQFEVLKDMAEACHQDPKNPYMTYHFFANIEASEDLVQLELASYKSLYNSSTYKKFTITPKGLLYLKLQDMNE